MSTNGNLIKHSTLVSLSLVASLAAMLAGADAAFARAEIQCNKKQTKCVSESTQLSIGDSVGVFNDEGQLVATGEVIAMKGERRAVQVDKKNGTIRRDYNLALLETKPSDPGFEKAYTLYHEPAQMAVGATAGLATVAIGDGSPAMEYSAFGQYRTSIGLQLIGRGVYTSTQGEVTHYAAQSGLETKPITVSGLGLLAGVGYVVREGKTLSFRGELAAGGMFVNAAIAGDNDLVDHGDYQARVKNGINPYGRGAVGLMLNFSSWHAHLDVAEGLIAQAQEQTLALGLSRDLK